MSIPFHTLKPCPVACIHLLPQVQAWVEDYERSCDKNAHEKPSDLGATSTLPSDDQQQPQYEEEELQPAPPVPAQLPPLSQQQQLKQEQRDSAAAAEVEVPEPVEKKKRPGPGRPPHFLSDTPLTGINVLVPSDSLPALVEAHGHGRWLQGKVKVRGAGGPMESRCTHWILLLAGLVSISTCVRQQLMRRCHCRLAALDTAAVLQL